MGGGVGSIYKNRPSHHKHKSPKQFLLIAYSKTNGLNGSERTLSKLCVTSITFLKTKVGHTKNRPSENLHKRGLERNRINVFATNCFSEQLTMIS